MKTKLQTYTVLIFNFVQVHSKLTEKLGDILLNGTIWFISSVMFCFSIEVLNLVHNICTLFDVYINNLQVTYALVENNRKVGLHGERTNLRPVVSWSKHLSETVGNGQWVTFT